MEYAVIKTGGKQYRVKRGDIIEVDKLSLAKDSSYTFEDVLLWVGDGTVKIGMPIISDVNVTAKVLEQKKGEKIEIYKFKAKARYRRHTGFRARLTRLQIEKIESGKVAKPAGKTVEKKEVKAPQSQPRPTKTA